MSNETEALTYMPTKNIFEDLGDTGKNTLLCWCTRHGTLEANLPADFTHF